MTDWQRKHLLAEGEYCCFAWRVRHSGTGYRCGYVVLPSDHPWYDIKEPTKIDATVHGGMVYASFENDDDDDGAYEIGFDCGHNGDGTDWSLPFTTDNERHYQQAWEHQRPHVWRDSQVVRTTAYVEEQCKWLCFQAAEVYLGRSFAWDAYLTPEVLGIARTMVQDWSLTAAPILADALEDANCPYELYLRLLRCREYLDDVYQGVYPDNFLNPIKLNVCRTACDDSRVG